MIIELKIVEFLDNFEKCIFILHPKKMHMKREKFLDCYFYFYLEIYFW